MVPPFLIFTKGVQRRDVIFRGIAVPGASSLSAADDLTAVWKTKDGERFQNYKAVFTILDEQVVTRQWINDLAEGNSLSINAPVNWGEWVKHGVYNPLKAPRSTAYRTRAEQTPSLTEEIEIIKSIYGYFGDGYAFEKCAAQIFQLMSKNVLSCDLTRPWVDGGRDATGIYRIGENLSSTKVEFALEAKKYDLDAGIGVKEVARLISRIRHRQFGVLVTTSYVSLQAYKEIVQDGHPVIIISAKDIVDILKHNGYSTKIEVQKWLRSNFPLGN